jgi:hypothetical protein
VLHAIRSHEEAMESISIAVQCHIGSSTYTMRSSVAVVVLIGVLSDCRGDGIRAMPWFKFDPT